MSEPEEQRAQWGSGIGFILAAIGSAVGFGSISRFPMNAANNGGAAFVLLYAGLMILIGIPMMIAEFSIGRSAQRNTVGAFKHLQGNARTGWRAAGVLYFAMAAFFLSWYAVASGWVLRYIWAAATSAYAADPTGYLVNTVEGPDALFWTFLVMAMTLAVVISKISAGIEKLNIVLMPTLFLIILGLAAYAATLPNAGPGYAFYLNPDFSKITIAVVIAAVGQAFFSLSLGQGAMMTYASYLPKTTSLAKNATIIAMSTLIFATACGFMIFPMLSSFGLLGTGAAGLDLIFGPLTQAFLSMGTLGIFVGVLFFLATFFAAFTSAVSLTEPAIAYVVEEWNVDRRRAAILVCTLIYAAAVAAAFSQRLLQLEGGAITDALVILGGLLIALYVGWFTPAAVARQRMDEGKGWKLSWYVLPIVRYVMPAVLTVLLILAVVGTPCALTGGAASGGLWADFFGRSLVGCAGPP